MDASYISKFIENTCRIHHRPNLNKFMSLFYCANYCEDPPPTNGVDVNCFSLSGSASEFYIDPILPLIGDFDIMRYHNNQLVVQTGFPLPKSLPSEFHHEISVYDLEETAYPCYVLVRHRCSLIKACDGQFYEIGLVSNCNKYFIKAEVRDPLNPHYHGPADIIEDMVGLKEDCFLSIDSVLCIRCLEWPAQAMEWPKRMRKFGWPDKSTIERTVKNGCHVVQISHPMCRQNKQLAALQWRLSFSLAETVLLNTMSPKQQMVYHILRYLVKHVSSEVEPANINRGPVIHNYYVKTALLWNCERHLCSWWESKCIVTLCSDISKELVQWVILRKYAMYFVTECNLCDNISDDVSVQLATNTCNYLLSLNKRSLVDWLVKNYVLRCADHCGVDYGDSWNSNIQNLMCEIINCRQDNVEELSGVHFEQIFLHYQNLWYNFSYQHVAYLYTIRQLYEQLPGIDSRFADLCFAMSLLHVVSKLERKLFNVGLVNVLLASTHHYHNNTVNHSESDELYSHICNSDLIAVFNKTQSVSRSRTISSCSIFQVAAILMQRLRLRHKFMDPSLITEASKAYVHLSLECKRKTCYYFHNKYNNVVRLYLACLYYSAGQYQRTIDLCNEASTGYRFGERGMFPVERQLLPQFDDRTESVFGFIILYEAIQSTMQRWRHRQVDILTADLYACYLAMTCLTTSPHRCNAGYNVIDRYDSILFRRKSLLIADLLLRYVVHDTFSGFRKQIQFETSRRDSRTSATVGFKFNAGRMSSLLLRSAVKHLTAFRLKMSSDFRNIRTVVSTDFLALYAYRRGFYEECFRLSKDSLERLLYAPSKNIVSALLIPSDLLLLVDDDLSCLLGSAALLGVPDELDRRIMETINQMTLSMYSLVKSKLKLTHNFDSFIDTLKDIVFLHERYPPDFIINRSIMTFLYRTVMCIWLNRRIRLSKYAVVK